MSISYINKTNGNKLAYIHIKPSGNGKKLPAVIFLGGFKSDMAGTKAVFLEQQCITRGQEFIRFDYSGHGQSEGEFINGTIGSWKNDALSIIDNITKRDIILVGSSMGGWISLLLLLEREKRIKAMIGIASAPDFTKDIEQRMNDNDLAMIEKLGRLEIPNEYSDEPYIFTKELLKDGAQQSILDRNHKTTTPIILIQGKQDPDVPWEKALKIKNCFLHSNVKIIFIDDGDHRLSRKQDLNLINAEIIKI